MKTAILTHDSTDARRQLRRSAKRLAGDVLPFWFSVERGEGITLYCDPENEDGLAYFARQVQLGAGYTCRVELASS